VRIFLYEFITSGALSGQPLPPSLLREGLAMRRAVIADLLAIGGIEAISTRDHRVPPLDLSHLIEHTVDVPSAEIALFRSLCSDSDLCLVIAPEIGGELERRVTLAIDAAGRDRVWNSRDLIATASDKWETYLRLKKAGVPTIETCLATSYDWRAWDHPVAKPRDGAGSQDVRRLSIDDVSLSDGWIVQPFVRGRWLSCTILFFPDARQAIFPPAEQRIADDGSFTYLGGVMPRRCDIDRVQSLASQAVRAVTDDPPTGPVGVDLVEDERTGEILVCEVNPRFTTSYIAARELSESNLLAGLIDPDAPPPAWRPHRVEFDADGSVRVCR
jgi:tyramine---L-glutamate ligase